MINPKPVRIDAAAAEKIPIPFAVPVFGKIFAEVFCSSEIFATSVGCAFCTVSSVLSAVLSFDGTTEWSGVLWFGTSGFAGVGFKLPFSSTPVEPIVPVYSGTSTLGA